MSIEALFFDLCNTLITLDYSRLPEVEHHGQRLRTTTLKVYRELVDNWRLRLDYQEFLDAFRTVSGEYRELKQGGREFPSQRRFRMLADRIGVDDGRAVDRMVEIHMEQLFQTMVPRKGVQQLLASLDGRPRYLASNFDHAATARRALKAFGLESHFDQVFISDEVGWIKPSPRFFQHIVAASGCRPERCLFVGDDPLADCGAAQVGFRTVWLRRDHRDDSPQPPPWRIISDINEIPSIVNSDE